MDLAEFLVVTVATAAGTIVHASVGIGLGLVAGPALVAIDTDFVPAPLLVVGQLVNARNILAERDHIDRRGFHQCMWGVPVGLVFGLFVLEVVSERTMAILVGSFTALAALALLCGLGLRRSRAVDTAAGAATSFASVTAALPGPPLVLAFNDLPPRELRGTAGSVIAVVATIAVISLLITGNIGTHELELMIALLPGIVLGLLVGRRVRPYLDRRWFRPAVLGIAFFGGLALIGRQVL